MLHALYTALDAHFAHEPHWWPIFTANRQFEVMVGAVLVQQTRWEAVEAAVQRLIAHDWLSPAALAAADTAELAALIRPCAFHSQKATGLQAIARYLLERYDGETTPLFAKERAELRAELLALPRIGRETADTMMLYAGEHPLFIADAYARRLFHRVGVLPSFDFLRAPYDAVQAVVEAGLGTGSWELGAAKQELTNSLTNEPRTNIGEQQLNGLYFVSLAPSSQSLAPTLFYRNFHALITEACIHHCLTKPRCDLPGAHRRFVDPRKCAEHCRECSGCPLRGMCAAYQEQRTENRE